MQIEFTDEYADKIEAHLEEVTKEAKEYYISGNIESYKYFQGQLMGMHKIIIDLKLPVNTTKHLSNLIS